MPDRVSEFPRLRYMGSKYRLIPHLAEVFTETRRPDRAGCLLRQRGGLLPAQDARIPSHSQ